jgi:hypothetical protein
MVRRWKAASASINSTLRWSIATGSQAVRPVRYALAVAAISGDAPDTALVRSRRTRAGDSLNIEQAVTVSVSVPCRMGRRSGRA